MLYRRPFFSPSQLWRAGALTPLQRPRAAVSFYKYRGDRCIRYVSARTLATHALQSDAIAGIREAYPNDGTASNVPQYGPLDENSSASTDIWLERGKGDDETIAELDEESPPLEVNSPLIRIWTHVFARIFPGSEGCPDAEPAKTLAMWPVINGDLDDHTVDLIQAQWESRCTEQRLADKADLSVAARGDSVETALRLLAVLPEFPGDFDVRMSCLRFMKRARGHEIASHPPLQRLFRDQVAWQRDRPIGWRKFRRAYVQLVLEESTVPEAWTFSQQYLSVYGTRDASGILAFVDFFTKHKDVDRALTMFRELPSALVLESKDALLQRCTNLLKLDQLEVQGSTPTFKVLQHLLELGMQPNKYIYNVIICNAISAGLHGVAWDLLRHAVSENVYIRGRTYVRMVRDAFLRREMPLVNELLYMIHARENLHRDPFVVAYTMDLVRQVMFREGRHSPREAFSHMLAIYSRAYNHRILKKLGMVDESSAFLNATDLPDPDPCTLAFVISTYVLIQRDWHRVNSLRAWLQQQISQDDGLVVQAAQHDVFYHPFIHFYARHVHTVPKCMEVVQEMIELKQCDPSPRTWTLLMSAFIRHGQEDAAEAVRLIMIQRGVGPSHHQWDFPIEQFPHSSIVLRIREWQTKHEDGEYAPEDDEHLLDGVLKPGPETSRGDIDNLPHEWNGLLDLRALAGMSHGDVSSTA